MRVILWVSVIILSVANVALADTFGTGANQFTIDFVNISGDAGDLGSWPVGSDYTFSGVNHGDYRMGKFEITNDQWNKFQTSYGAILGNPYNAYNENVHFAGTDVPTNEVSWYEGAQFVNYLNTSTGHSAAYKFTGTQGTGDYTFSVWGPGDSGYDSDNPYRNSEAYYFMPTEDEWVKAAYWNGTSLQTYATKAGESLTQGDGTSETGWNYYANGYATDPYGPWDVGSGSEELNGTFDMMGNVFEWMESPYFSEDYLSDDIRRIGGGAYNDSDYKLSTSYRGNVYPEWEYPFIGFRVASVPEPCSLVLLSLGGLMLRRKYRR